MRKSNDNYLEKNRHACRWKSPICKNSDRIVGHGVGSAKRNKETLGNNVASARNITLNGSCLNLIITYPQQREIKKHRNIETYCCICKKQLESDNQLPAESLKGEESANDGEGEDEGAVGGRLPGEHPGLLAGRPGLVHARPGVT